MENQFEVGQRVMVPVKSNSVWAGEGVVRRILGMHSNRNLVSIEMLTGRMAGSVGAFEPQKLITASEPVIDSGPKPMSIISIKRTTGKSPMKLYGTFLGEFGKVYNFAYYRGTRREWVCECKDFFFSQLGRNGNGNCKHLRAIRAEVGRYGATVEPTRKPKAIPSAIDEQGHQEIG